MRAGYFPAARGLNTSPTQPHAVPERDLNVFLDYEIVLRLISLATSFRRLHVVFLNDMLLRGICPSLCLRRTWYSAGDLFTTTDMSDFARISFVSGNCITCTTSAWMRVSRAGGIFAGAKIPFQAFVPRPGKPASATVGRSGSSGRRVGQLVAPAP